MTNEGQKAPSGLLSRNLAHLVKQVGSDRIRQFLSASAGDDLPFPLHLLFVCQRFTGPARAGLLYFLNDKGRKVPWLSGGGRFRSETSFSARLKRNVALGSLDLSEDVTIFLVDGIPVLARQEGTGEGIDRGILLYFPRGLFGLDYFPRQALELVPGRGAVGYNRFEVIHVGVPDDMGDEDSDGSRPRKRRNQQYARIAKAQSPDGGVAQGSEVWFERGVTWEDLREPDPCEGVAELALTPSAELAVNFVRMWFSARDDYELRRIIWRASLLFEGPPGTGKTALARALAFEMKLPIYVFHLASLDSHAFESSWRNVVENAPAVVLLDDFDRVFHGDKRVGDEGPSFNLVLQALSGVEEVSGLLTIIAVNQLERVHPTIYDGQSEFGRRVTMRATFDLPKPEQRGAIARRILFDFEEAEIDEVVRRGKNDSGKQFVDRCAMAVIARLERRAGVQKAAAPDLSGLPTPDPVMEQYKRWAADSPGNSPGPVSDAKKQRRTDEEMSPAPGVMTKKARPKRTRKD